MIYELFIAWCYFCVFVLIPLMLVADELNRARRVGYYRFKWTKKLDDWLYKNKWFRKVK